MIHSLVKEDTTLVKILQAVKHVRNHTNYGLVESCYRDALAVELRKAFGHIEVERTIPLMYDEKYVMGDGRADIIVGQEAVLELKASSTKSSPRQVQNYCVQMGIPVGLTIQFGKKDSECKQVRIDILLRADWVKKRLESKTSDQAKFFMETTLAKLDDKSWLLDEIVLAGTLLPQYHIHQV